MIGNAVFALEQDKWRNMSPSLEQVTKKKRKNLKSSFRFTVPSLSRPSGTSRNVVIDSKTEERCVFLIRKLSFVSPKKPFCIQY